MSLEKRIYLSPPWVDARERASVAAAFDSGYVAPCGPMVDAFERRLAALSGCAVAAVASGTAAMDLLMDEFGVDASWTVYASDLTFIASVGPAFRRGARCMFVDSARDSGTMDVALLEAALREAAAPRDRRLVIATDIYGRCCDYEALERVCAEAGARLVVDAAEAVGAAYAGAHGVRPAGQAGDAAIYSFNGNKIVTTSGGGAVLSRTAAVADRARKRSQQSRENTVWYEHLEVGHNYRLSNISAAIGVAQLDKLPEILERRRKIHAAYADVLRGRAEAFPSAPYVRENHWLSVWLFADAVARDRAAAALTAQNVESRPVWKPMHLQPVFRECPFVRHGEGSGAAVSEDLFARGLCLPSGAALAEDGAARTRIVGCLRSF